MNSFGPIDWSSFDEVQADRGQRAAPGAVVGVVRAGSRPEFRSFGAVSPGGELLTEATPIYVASVAKQFTAAAVARLVLDGVVALDEGVAGDRGSSPVSITEVPQVIGLGGWV